MVIRVVVEGHLHSKGKLPKLHLFLLSRRKIRLSLNTQPPLSLLILSMPALTIGEHEVAVLIIEAIRLEQPTHPLCPIFDEFNNEVSPLQLSGLKVANQLTM